MDARNLNTIHFNNKHLHDNNTDHTNTAETQTSVLTLKHFTHTQTSPLTSPKKHIAP